jgi:hypothetical protein
MPPSPIAAAPSKTYRASRRPSGKPRLHGSSDPHAQFRVHLPVCEPDARTEPIPVDGLHHHVQFIHKPPLEALVPTVPRRRPERPVLRPPTAAGLRLGMSTDRRAPPFGPGSKPPRAHSPNPPSISRESGVAKRFRSLRGSLPSCRSSASEKMFRSSRESVHPSPRFTAESIQDTAKIKATTPAVIPSGIHHKALNRRRAAQPLFELLELRLARMLGLSRDPPREAGSTHHREEPEGTRCDTQSRRGAKAGESSPATRHLATSPRAPRRSPTRRPERCPPATLSPSG